MKSLYFLLLSIAFLGISCEKPQEEVEPEWLNAVVEVTSDVNCGFPRLNFFEDAEKVKAITGDDFHLSFVSKGLPDELNIQGKELKVQVANLLPEESFACLTLGYNYPSIKIKGAKGR